MLKALAAQFEEDVRQHSLASALGRAALTGWFALSERRLFREVLGEPAYGLHVAALASRDRFGFAAHRCYLVRGLSRRARAVAALQHYRNERAALDAAYQEAVYRRGGLSLWRVAHEETVFEIRLLPGQQVMNEGGLSVTFLADAQPIFVLSYSNIDPALLRGGPAATSPRELVPFVGRRQGVRHLFRAAFTRAFGRGTPGHFCMSALEGIALAQGCSRVLGVVARLHPSHREALKRGRPGLEEMYDGFWRSLSGVPAGDLAWEVPVPLRPTPLDQLDSHNRRRANRLRAHQAAVRDAAFGVYRSHLVAPPATPHETGRDGVVRSGGIPDVPEILDRGGCGG